LWTNCAPKSAFEKTAPLIKGEVVVQVQPVRHLFFRRDGNTGKAAQQALPDFTFKVKFST
jgi:hypothetical protein